MYSLRDSLGQELTWSTGRRGRAQLCALADVVNAIGEGAVIFNVRTPYAMHVDDVPSPTPVSLRAHQLPVAVYRVTPIVRKGA